MQGILIAFPGEKTRTHIAGLLESAGIRVAASCSTGIETISMAKRMKSGIVLAGEGLYDMSAQDLRECLPKGFYMVLLARETQLQNCDGEITKLVAPASQQMLVDAIRGIQTQIEEKIAAIPRRSEEDRALIARAKHQLMDKNAFSEEEAYRYIQKISMNLGFKMVQTAQSILDGKITA